MGFQGFFPAPTLNRAPLSLIPKCGECGLFKTCVSPKMPYSGKGKRKILLLGEAPGKNEDDKNRQFVGESGSYLQSILTKVGIDMREDCWLHNAVICRPPKNELPEGAVDHCRPNLVKTLQELKPEIIIPLGATAVKSLIGWLWKEDVDSINRWVGWRIPCQRDGYNKEFNCWICPTWHPSYLQRSRKDPSIKNSGVMEKFFEEHLRAAAKLQGRPWKEVPDYKSKVRILYTADEAIPLIREFAKGNKPIAFDYETTMLKPDSTRAQIYSCSISDGKTTIAFPWLERIAPVVGELLKSNLPKIGFNAKFEDRWTRKEFGHGVNNWLWCGMLAAHTLDNRKLICSLKFQSFILLGQQSYDDHIKPYLQGKDSNSPNKIKELDLKQLLLYNGLDSLLEWKVAKIQMRSMGYEYCKGDS